MDAIRNYYWGESHAKMSSSTFQSEIKRGKSHYNLHEKRKLLRNNLTAGV